MCFRIPTSLVYGFSLFVLKGYGIKISRNLRSLLSGSCRHQDYYGLLKNKSQPYHIKPPTSYSSELNVLIVNDNLSDYNSH